MASTEELAVEYWAIDEVTPYAKNPRKVGEQAVAKVAASLAAYGWRQPIVVDAEGVIIAGHTRLLAAQHLGYEQVPVHVARGLSPAQVKAYRIADNRAAQENRWDAGLLSLEVADLKAMGADLGALGLDPDELAAALALAPAVGKTDEDAVPPLPAEATTKSGEVWVLGDHRLLCGDSTKPAHVARVMAGERATLMATDPPYLVDYDGGNHPPTWANGGKKPGAAPDAGTKHWDSYVDHDTAVKFYKDFLSVAVEHALTKTPMVYMFFGMMRAPLVFEAWEKAGLLLHQVLIWNKSRIVLSRSDHCWNYEPIAYGWLKGARPRAARRPPANSTAVWQVSSAILDGRQDHPTCKPVELVRRPIEYHTKPGEVIYEPFCGSGTAIIAAEMTGRSCRALEIAPAYCDVAVKRWEAFTGRKAIRDGALN